MAGAIHGHSALNKPARTEIYQEVALNSPVCISDTTDITISVAVLSAEQIALRMNTFPGPG